MHILLSSFQNFFVIDNAHKDEFLFIKILKMEDVVKRNETNLAEVAGWSVIESLKLQSVRVTCKDSSAGQRPLWLSPRYQSSTEQTPTSSPAPPASLARRQGPRSCSRERRTPPPASWLLRPCTWTPSRGRTCCGIRPGPATGGSPVSLLRGKLDPWLSRLESSK